MDELGLVFLPYPHVYRGDRKEGVLRKWPDRCKSCDRQCERSIDTGIQVCSYGINYVRIDDDLLVAGIVARDFDSSTSAYKKMRKKFRSETIRVRDLESVVHAAEVDTTRVAEDLAREKKAVLDEYQSAEQYKSELLEQLRPDIQRALAQVHDYRQLIAQIVQNINVIVLTEFPDDDIHESLDKSSHELQAIYWSARLMESKLEAALFLMYPEKISDSNNYRVFRLHGLILKYVRIYQRSFDRQRLRLKVIGESFGEVRANPDAVGVIPHAFLDNAFKYSPQAGRVTIKFEESSESIEFSVSSYGPLILPDERERIFDIFFRGQNALPRAVEGTGFGLALVDLVARNIGIDIEVDQEPQPGPEDSYLTTFTARIERFK
jgi:signal transduction histidine kinase